MSHDDASGIISYNNKNDSINITWDRVGYEKNFEAVNHAMEKVTKGLGGTFVKNPMWTRALGKSVISAHPLGGCPMGESGRTAVVNHAGQVFDGMNNNIILKPVRVLVFLIVFNPLGTLATQCTVQFRYLTQCSVQECIPLVLRK